jgi:hypothetical protein
MPISINNTKKQSISIDKRWVNLVFNVTINTEDVTAMLNFHDLFIGTMPLNFLFYDYTFWNHIEVTEFTKQWDFVNDEIDNVYQQFDQTFKYEPTKIYKESNEDFFASKDRDRELGRDDFPVLEGYRYFSMVEMQPIIKLNGITKQTDKETSLHSLILNFEARIEIPNLLIWQQEYTIESIEIVIDTVSVANHPQKYPILIDIPENFLTNKNISRGIMLSAGNFVFADPQDPNAPLQSYLEVESYVDTDVFSVALWAVENVTETSSSRFFIPLEHATIEYVRDAQDNIIATRFYFREMTWLEEFDFEDPFNYLKLIMFVKQASIP